MEFFSLSIFISAAKKRSKRRSVFSVYGNISNDIRPIQLLFYKTLNFYGTEYKTCLET